jgi:protein-tyrosine kinase
MAMSLIEQAARRLEELRRVGIKATPNLDPGAPPDIEVRAASQAAAAEPPRGTPLKLDLAKLAAEGFITPDAPRSRIADEFRVIKRPLIANATGKGAKPIRHGNLIMVTSAVNGEGKSFTAANLAMSIALEPDRTVLLVDADVAKPSLPRTLGISEHPGLLDVLNKSVELGEVLHPTNVEKLAFMFSGRPHARATEMLASDAMSELLNELAARHPERIVVFDSPPLLDATEARVLATRMGQIVFVVDAESTLQADVKHALASIEACPTKLTVLNKARTTAQGAYGYRYGHGH